MSQEASLSSIRSYRSSSDYINCQAELKRPPSLLVTQGCGKFECEGSSSFISFLQKLRDTIAEHQENKGVSKHEQFGFFKLVGTLIQNAVCAIVTIFIMFYNLLPLMEGVLYLARFILDKAIEISESETTTEVILKVILFILELTFITLMIMTICAFILFPVIYLLSNIYGQVMEIFTE